MIAGADLALEIHIYFCLIFLYFISPFLWLVGIITAYAGPFPHQGNWRSWEKKGRSRIDLGVKDHE
jgi:hypothetical protein